MYTEIEISDYKNPVTGVIDEISGAVGAYSLKKLKSTASKSIRVRRSSDNTEKDIIFVGKNLDIVDLLSFVGSGSGYVTKWYDQSGCNNDAIQTSAANQFRIVELGVLCEALKNPSTSNLYLSIPSLENTNFPQNEVTVLHCYKKITAWTAGYADYSRIFGSSSTDKKQMSITKLNTDNQIRFSLQTGVAYNTFYSQSTSFSETDYTQFAFAYNLGASSSKAKCYKNAVLINENTSITPNLYVADMAPNIGHAISGYHKYILIFNRYLTSAEIAYINNMAV